MAQNSNTNSKAYETKMKFENKTPQKWIKELKKENAFITFCARCNVNSYKASNIFLNTNKNQTLIHWSVEWEAVWFLFWFFFLFSAAGKKAWFEQIRFIREFYFFVWKYK